MRIDLARRLGTVARPLAASLVAATLSAASAVAQQAEGAPLYLVDQETRVESVGFRFVSGSAIDEARLRQNIATRGAGALAGVRDALDFIPGVSGPVRPNFSPLSLQRDLVRLRRLYGQEGFPEAALDYEVRLDTTRNRVRVDFVVDQGAPVTLGSLVPSIPDLPEELQVGWERRVAELGRARGRRYGAAERARLENEAVDWFLERGYPWATARVEERDTTEREVRVDLVVMPGPRARVDEIVIEGRSRLSERVLRREMPIRVGDWYDASAVSEAESQLYELDLVTRALGDVPDDQPRDSTVSLRFRVQESRPRLIWGRAGWRSESGVAGELHWSHRDFLGGARTFTASATAETGWAALEQARGRSGGVSAVLRQPYLWHRNVSGTFGPFVRVRDDFRDRSVLFGVETALIHRARPLETLTLQHELSRLRVDEAFQLLSMEELATSGPRDFPPVFVKSVFKLFGSYGRLDDRVDPRSGWAVEPTLELTGPASLSDIEFFRIAGSGMAAMPLTDAVSVFLRGSAGRLFPFGESDPGSAALETRAVVGLRGYMFTAGGTSDVRGWGPGMLGPKVPQVELDATRGVVAERYVPVGGLARLTGSVEVGLPFPFLPPAHRTFVFLDAGRVWTPGDRFTPGDPELAVEPWGFGTGGGVQIATPVGPVRLGVGYKLNPDRIDLLAPGEVAGALASGGDLSGLEADGLRRWHLHLSIGRSF